MISICCTEPKPDFQEFSDDEKKIFCRMVYFLRKRGCTVGEAQKVAFQQIFEDSISFDMGR